VPAVAVIQEEQMLIILWCKIFLDFLVLYLNNNFIIIIIYYSYIELFLSNWNFLSWGGIHRCEKEYRILIKISKNN